MTYDIKLFKLMRATQVGSGTIDLANEVIQYNLEIFNLNEPEVLYKFVLPVHQMGSKSRDPVSFIVDLFNLVDHPFPKDSHSKRRKQESQEDVKEEAKVDSSKYNALFRKYIDN